MNFSVSCAGRSLQEFCYQRLFAADLFQGPSPDEMAAQSVADIVEHRSGSFTEEALRAVFLEFEDQTQKLYRAMGTFEFPNEVYPIITGWPLSPIQKGSWRSLNWMPPRPTIWSISIESPRPKPTEARSW